MCTRKLLKWSWRCIKLYSVKIVRESLQYMTAMGLHDVIRGEVLSRARSSVFFFSFLLRKEQNFQVSAFQSAKSSRRQKTRARWLKCGGLPHPDRVDFSRRHDEREMSNDVAVNLGESISVSLQSVGFMKSYIRLRYFVREIDRSSGPRRSSEINNYVCCACNIGRLINRLSAFTWKGGGRDRDINKLT